MKVAVLTGNISKIDKVNEFPKQNVAIDYFYYDEKNLPFPLPNLNSRTKSRYLKIQTHRFLCAYDAYIWMDGSIKVTGQNFAQHLLDKLDDEHDMVMYKSNERTTVFDEVAYIIEYIGKEYLAIRYAHQSMIQELIFYKNEKVVDEPIYNSFVFCRKNTEKVNNAFDEWWRRCIEFSNFDQAMFSYVAKKYSLKIKALEYDQDKLKEIFMREKHIEMK